MQKDGWKKEVDTRLVFPGKTRTKGTKRIIASYERAISLFQAKINVLTSVLEEVEVIKTEEI